MIAYAGRVFDGKVVALANADMVFDPESLRRLELSALDRNVLLSLPARSAPPELLWLTMESPSAHKIDKCTAQQVDHCLHWPTCGTPAPTSWDGYLFRGRPLPADVHAALQFPMNTQAGENHALDILRAVYSEVGSACALVNLFNVHCARTEQRTGRG